VRPIRLEMRGVTAFRDEQAIDFTALDLFAISGPTGSGKTSILDAITYALFGYIDRVGRHAALFISQGQPRLAVTLEFAVGQERLRVTRSTPARGASRILLERWAGAGWSQAGEGADRIRDVDAAIREAIGLDYDAFTRTVLLPQGKFAEFLVGDARTRRDILTELLGLELFERLARRAGDVRREAVMAAETRTQLLDREYAGVTPDAVAEAERIAKEAAQADARAADVEERIRELAGRWGETARSVAELRASAAEVDALRAAAADAADALETIGEELGEAEAHAETQAAAAAAAAKDAELATQRFREARESWGSAAELGALLARAETFAERRSQLAEVEAELAAASQTVPALEASVARAEQLVAVAVADAEAALSALGEARDTVEAASHADHVAAVRAGMRAGDDCPVCGAHVASLPKGRGAPTLEKAKVALAKAEAAARGADVAMREATITRDEAERSLEAARADVARAERERTRTRAELDALRAELANAFAGRLPKDPAVELGRRVERLEELDAACDTAAQAARAASDRAAAAEREAAEIRTRVAEVRALVEAVPLAAAIERATALLGVKVAVPRRPAKKDATTLAVYAGGLAAALEDLAGSLASTADERAAGEAEMLEEAASIVDGFVEPEPSLAALVPSVSVARTAAARTAATAEQRAEDLRTKLANAERIVEEANEHRARASRFEMLAKELRADRVIAFLQAEALQLLAAAGSRRLETLSGGRYRLEHAEDEFSVIDTWNGEERRSARTLSGGETFLASLALALGLSEQVRALAVSDRARLDALFLDEGFGTLDPESLEVVVEAIEQLGGDGRMVGVITHVQELALRLPARIEIEKSPRGSRVRVVTEAGARPPASRGGPELGRRAAGVGG
jgi:DNA repair protein SbcC/Rad50